MSACALCAVRAQSLMVLNRYYLFAVLPNLTIELYGLRNQTVMYGIVIAAAATFNYANYFFVW